MRAAQVTCCPSSTVLLLLANVPTPVASAPSQTVCVVRSAMLIRRPFLPFCHPLMPLPPTVGRECMDQPGA